MEVGQVRQVLSYQREGIKTNEGNQS